MMVTHVISSGFEALDKALDIGGYPKGRIVQMFGPKGVGKGALCLRAIAEAERAALVDADRSFDPGRAENAGVDLERLTVCQPADGEDALSIALALTLSGDHDLVVINPLGVRRTERTDFSRTLRKLCSFSYVKNTAIIAVSQQSGDDPAMGVTPSAALRYYSSVALDVRRADSAGTRVRVVKNKLGKPFQAAELAIAEVPV